MLNTRICGFYKCPTANSVKSGRFAATRHLKYRNSCIGDLSRGRTHPGGIKYNPLSLVCIVVAVCACNECISEGYFSLILLTLSERAVIKVPYTSTPINLLFNCSYDGL